MKKYVFMFALCILSTFMLQAKSKAEVDAEIKALEDKKAILDQRAYSAQEDADRLLTNDFFGSNTASDSADRYHQQAQQIQLQIDALKGKRSK